MKAELEALGSMPPTARFGFRQFILHPSSFPGSPQQVGVLQHATQKYKYNLRQQPSLQTPKKPAILTINRRRNSFQPTEEAVQNSYWGLH
jgi:hypothetical protein